jgi:hypothetical protein
MEVSQREAALLNVIRTLGKGYIEGLGVADGQPTVLKGVVQRLELTHPADLARALASTDGNLLIGTPKVDAEEALKVDEPLSADGDQST